MRSGAAEVAGAGDVIARSGDRYHRAFVTSLPPAPDPVTPARWHRRALIVVLVVVFALVTAPGPATGTPQQDPTATTAPETGLDPVPDVDEAPGVTDDPTSEEGDGAGGSTVAAENRRIWLVVGGLVAVALALSLLTFRYWRHTRPVPVDSRSPQSPRRSGWGDHSRRAVAGADHAAADESWEPRGTGEHDRVVAPPRQRQSRPTRSQRAGAYRARSPSDR
ncbi:hypothetical protein BH23ACT2_BH23ACT2_17750 [soil metagenome]